MKITELLKDIVSDHFLYDLSSLDIKTICDDSRKVQKDSLFIVRKGFRYDGQDFIEEAISKGARIILKEGPLGSHLDSGKAYVFNVDDSQQALRTLIHRFWGNLSQEIKMIGITGTNGKTTIAYLIESILKNSKKSCGVIGTINYRYGSHIFPAPNTTPGILDLHLFLANLARNKIPYCVMEVSSHALDQGRVDLIDFRCAIFTNLTSDHLDYHKDRESYFQAKAKLFSHLAKDGIAVINQDDEYGCKLIEGIPPPKILIFGLQKKSNLTARNIQYSLAGSRFILQSHYGEIPIETSLIGKHNVYNILAAVGCCLHEGISLKNIKRGIEELASVPGRLEAIKGNQNFYIFVDYAHTEDALQNILLSIKQVTDAKIILVFGCGGDRDKTKRPKMGKIACQYADLIILTNDNPRSERPDEIAEQIVSGMTQEKYMVILDRQEAILKALQMAAAGDVVLVAAKGHENYQIFKDQTIHFDDREVIQDFLKSKFKKAKRRKQGFDVNNF